MACRKRWSLKEARARCGLCGYETEEYLVFPVPLASPPQHNLICMDCAEEIEVAVQELRKAEVIA